MIVNAYLSIGYPGAMVQDTLEIDDEELVDLTEQEKEDHINEAIDEWAAQFVEAWYEEA